MNHITVKKALPSDVEPLRLVGTQAFVEAFSAYNTEENMRQYLEERFSPQQLASELGNPDSEFYFACQGEEIVGYLKLNYGPAQTDLQDAQSLEIERIYVLNAYHGQKVGQILFDKALDVARQQNLQYIWLAVWEENKKAIRFYEKNEMVAFSTHIFRLGDDLQTDIMMKRTIQ